MPHVAMYGSPLGVLAGDGGGAVYQEVYWASGAAMRSACARAPPMHPTPNNCACVSNPFLCIPHIINLVVCPPPPPRHHVRLPPQFAFPFPSTPSTTKPGAANTNAPISAAEGITSPGPVTSSSANAVSIGGSGMQPVAAGIAAVSVQCDADPRDLQM